jgi:hypothetical protein
MKQFILTWEFKSGVNGMDWCESEEEAQVIVDENSFSKAELFYVGSAESIEVYGENAEEVDE